jgi:hypothetical protein
MAAPNATCTKTSEEFVIWLRALLGIDAMAVEFPLGSVDGRGELANADSRSSQRFIRVTAMIHPRIEPTIVNVMSTTRRTVADRTPWIVGSGRGVRRNCFKAEERDWRLDVDVLGWLVASAVAAAADGGMGAERSARCRAGNWSPGVGGSCCASALSCGWTHPISPRFLGSGPASDLPTSVSSDGRPSAALRLLPTMAPWYSIACSSKRV